MQDRIRRLAAALVTAGLALALASPSLAESRMAQVGGESSDVPMIFDLVVMRPIGLGAVLTGSVFYATVAAPMMAITRPSEIAKPLGPLVGHPARFTFKDPIGQHPRH